MDGSSALSGPRTSVLGRLETLDALYEGITTQDRTTPWVAVKLPNGHWSVGPDHEMGHRAEVADWADDEAKFLAALVNAWPHLRAIVEAAKEDADGAGCLEPVPDEVGSRDTNGVYHDTYSDCGHCVTCRIRQSLGALGLFS